MPDAVLHDVFVSYKHESRTRHFIEVLETRLDKAKITCWRDKNNIRIGQQWSREIDNALRACRAVIIVITPEATKSQYVTYEWCFAAGLGKGILPVLFEGDDIHAKLREREYLDFRLNDPWDKLINELQTIQSQPTGVEVEGVLGQDLTVWLEQLATSRTSRPIEFDDLIEFLMSRRSITHAQVRKIQDIITLHRSTLKP
jgi:hypothetical protein